MNQFLHDFIGATATIPSKTLGQLKVEAASFTAAIDGDLVVHFGKPFEQTEPLIRIHSECVFGELLHSDLCDCAEQLSKAMDRLRREGDGLLFYIRLDGRGAGLAAKVKATALEVAGVDTFESRIKIGVAPEGRDFSAIGRYLFERGVRQVRLLTNSPQKCANLKETGINVTMEHLLVEPSSVAVRQLYRTKKERFHHDRP
jgi:GTP cyclohydrolase II